MTSFNPEEVVRKLGSRLKMRHLMLLLQIEQHGSLTRVAEQMATSQPAVTNALSELESMFGVPLFERSARGMTPTPLGAVVLARARALVHDLGHMVQEMEALATGHAAHLNIGAIPFVSGQMLSAAIGRTLPQGRGITATIHEGQGPALLRQLRDHTLDIVVGWATPSVDLSGMRFETLYHQPPRLIASRRLAARLGRSRLEWNMLADLDWILGTADSPIREQVVYIFLRAGLAPPTPLVQSDSAKLIGEMIVANERAVSILPADIAEELVRIAGVAIVPYSLDWTMPPISLFMRDEGPSRNVEALFSAALREVYTHGLR
ncbi:LysR substrate-binding domain-containing protein [Achromobacter sp. AONIH1]|uniref:LysR substrate-binding domain-containing protein n=1 Tax=Achromobacter sp. AONIH1 TaxID=1758194 RepID=UPI000CD28C82|nr:LysR substrate-binding domain-containing protein [Achromobacter sp. AONIH1]AUT49705.1 LysR family transcriptional regulator [Achromobacter sp. AONIH1]